MPGSDSANMREVGRVVKALAIHADAGFAMCRPFPAASLHQEAPHSAAGPPHKPL